MAKSQTTRAQPENKILARTPHGDELELTVLERACLICIHTSDGRDLILAPTHATELCLMFGRSVVQAAQAR